MTDQVDFETRLGARLQAHAARASRPFDPVAIAVATVPSSRPERGFGRRLRRPSPVGILLVIGLVVAATVAGALMTGSRPVTPSSSLGPAPSTVVIPQRPLTIAATDGMSSDRAGHTATLLLDGTVLVAGGFNGRAFNGYGPERGDTFTAELFDRETRTFRPTGRMPEGRRDHAAIRLSDGRVLIVGGSQGGTILDTATVYDPASGTFSEVGRMATARSRPALVGLPDGRVAVIGGLDAFGAATPGVEYFDPATDRFSAGPSDSALAVIGARAFLMASGKITVVGGTTPTGDAAATDAIVTTMDPSTGTVSTMRRSDAPLWVVGATPLADGRLLLSAAPAGQDAWALIAVDGDGTQTTTASLDGRPVGDPVVIADGSVLLTVVRTSDCSAVDVIAVSLGSGVTTTVGQMPGVGTCNGSPAMTMTALSGGGALIAGGYTSGGETTNAASLVQSVRSSPQP